VNRVQVLLPIKFPAPWLEETLDSLQKQTFTDWKLVASIHGNEPAAKKIVSAFFPDAIQVEAPGSGNLASTLNAGLALTTSPLIARIDQDDIALPDRLEKQVKFLEREPKVTVVGSAALLIGPNGEELGLRAQEETCSKLHKKLRWKSPLIHPSTMFRGDLVRSIGGYSETATNVEDYELWLRLARHGYLGGIGEPLIKYRIHPHQITSYRTIPHSASAEVRRSRLALAESENESVVAARLRHLAWISRQETRRIRRRRRV
jgi:glycosyltransferase involved in cell wall biosynthesis